MKNILIIEKDATSVSRIIRILKKNYLVTLVINVDAFISVIGKYTLKKYDMIIMDPNLSPGSLYSMEESDRGMKTGILLYQNYMLDFTNTILIWSHSINKYSEIVYSENIILKEKDASDEDRLLGIIKQGLKRNS